MSTPRDAAAERAILTALIQDPGTFEKAYARVPNPDTFTIPLNRDIYAAIIRAVETSGVTTTPYDVYTIASDVEKRTSEVSPAGETPLEYLLGLAEAMPVANLTGAIAALTEADTRTRAAEALLLAAQEAADPNSDIRGTLTATETSIHAIAATLTEEIPAVQGLAEVAEDTIQRILNGDTNTYLPTGYSDLDDLLDGGCIPGGVYIIGARPSVGKSAFALDTARHMTIREKKNVLFLNLEMRPQDLVIRLVSAEKNIPASQLTRAMKTTNGADAALAQRLSAAYTTLMDEVSLSPDPLAPTDDGKGNLWLWSPYAASSTSGERRTVADVGALLDQMKAAGQVDALIVDYLQLLEPPRRTENRQQDVSITIRYLKELALRHNIPVIVLSQVNRGSTDRADKRPMLSDLRESGEIEQASDVVMLLHNESKANGGDPRDSLLEVIVAKNRHGRDGSFHLATELDYCRFADLDSSHIPDFEF